MNTTPATPSPRLLRAISAAHTFGRLEKALSALPGVFIAAVKSRPGFAALEAASLAAKQAETARAEALREIATGLTAKGDGWTEEQILAALDAPIARTS